MRSHLDRKRDTIAAMKSLGATGGRVFVIYLTQVLSLAAIGAVIGLVVGAALPFVDRLGLRQQSFRCRSSRRCIPGSSRSRLLYGLLTALRLRDLAARPRA